MMREKSAEKSRKNPPRCGGFDFVGFISADLCGRAGAFRRSLPWSPPLAREQLFSQARNTMARETCLVVHIPIVRVQSRMVRLVRMFLHPGAVETLGLVLRDRPRGRWY